MFNELISQKMKTDSGVRHERHKGQREREETERNGTRKKIDQLK